MGHVWYNAYYLFINDKSSILKSDINNKNIMNHFYEAVSLIIFKLPSQTKALLSKSFFLHITLFIRVKKLKKFYLFTYLERWMIKNCSFNTD